jgi:large subunit ribosomal protein L23
MDKLYKIVLKPIITEKSNAEMANNKYTFEVLKNANKTEIKSAIEKIYKVNVDKINTVNCKGKKVRWGKVSGKKSDWKKAIVVLKKGQKIEDLVG